jgi:hypothetical protein
MIDHSRRNFMKTSTAVAGLTLVHSLAPAELLGAVAPSDASTRLTPFPLSAVRLAPGIFSEQAEINARYLDSLVVDRLLHSFRLTAGISSTAISFHLNRFSLGFITTRRRQMPPCSTACICGLSQTVKASWSSTPRPSCI